MGVVITRRVEKFRGGVVNTAHEDLRDSFRSYSAGLSSYVEMVKTDSWTGESNDKVDHFGSYS